MAAQLDSIIKLIFVMCLENFQPYTCEFYLKQISSGSHIFNLFKIALARSRLLRCWARGSRKNASALLITFLLYTFTRAIFYEFNDVGLSSSSSSSSSGSSKRKSFPLIII